MTALYGIPLGRVHQIDTSGRPLSGALLYVYQTGTAIKLPLFSDNTGLSTATNPVVADSAGRFPIRYTTYADPMTLVLLTASSDPVWSDDGVYPQLTIGSVSTALAVGPDWINVTNVLYGATGDGSTDDSLAIQAAINAAYNAGGGIVYIPPGTYIAKNLVHKSRVTLVGDGPAVSILKAPASIGNSERIITNPNQTTFTDTDMHLYGLGFDGANAGAGAVQARYLDLAGYGRVTNISVKNCKFTNNEYIPLVLAACKHFELDVDIASCGYSGNIGTCTMTIASPCVVSKTAHGYSAGSIIKFESTGLLPTGLAVGTDYYVIAAGLTANAFEVSATLGGAAINTSGSQAGTHSVRTSSANCGPALFVGNYDYDQSEQGRIIVRSKDCRWHGATIYGRHITTEYLGVQNCCEAGIFSPHLPSSSLINYDMTLSAWNIDGITERDISGSGLELGGRGISLGTGTIAHVDHACAALLDCKSVTGGALGVMSDYNQDSQNSTPQGGAIMVFGLTASPGHPQNNNFGGAVLVDEAATATVTISNASPAVITWTAHGRNPNEKIVFTTSGGLPTGLSLGRGYYILADGMTVNSFQVSSYKGGPAINTSSAGSGTHTATKATNAYTAFAVGGTYACEDIVFEKNDVGRAVFTSGSPLITTKFGLGCLARNNLNMAATCDGRNLLINGGFSINQRLASTNADDTYCLDRWYALTQSNAIAVSQLTSPEANIGFGVRLTQSNASAQRMGLAQIIENRDSQGMVSSAGVFFGRVRLSTTATVRYAVLEWTGPADAVTSDVVNSWTNTTFTPGNFFNATTLNVIATGSVACTAATWRDLTHITGAFGASLTNIIVFMWTDATVAQNVTLDFNSVQLERGWSATIPYAPSFDQELARCQAFYQKTFAYATMPAQNTTGGILCNAYSTSFNAFGPFPFVCQMRPGGAPSSTTFNSNATNAQIRNTTRSEDCSLTGITANESHWTISCSASASTVVSDSFKFHATFEREL